MRKVILATLLVLRAEEFFFIRHNVKFAGFIYVLCQIRGFLFSEFNNFYSGMAIDSHGVLHQLLGSYMAGWASQIYSGMLIARVNPGWPLCRIHFTYYFVLLANVWWGLSALTSVKTNTTDLWLPLLGMSSSALVWQCELGSFPAASVF